VLGEVPYEAGFSSASAQKTWEGETSVMEGLIPFIEMSKLHATSQEERSEKLSGIWGGLLVGGSENKGKGDER